jgi:hypothetical protein
MTLSLPAQIAEAVEAVSRQSGVPVEQLVTDALRAHFPPLDSALQAEFYFWEEASARTAQAVDTILDEDA